MELMTLSLFSLTVVLMMGTASIVQGLPNEPALARKVQGEQKDCACQPETIRFHIALDQTCETSNMTPGIESLECKIENVSTGQVNVEPPAVITSILIIELDADRQIIGESLVSGSFTNGDMLEFKSEASGSESAPRAIQALIYGQQQLTSDRILNSVLVDFSSDCLLSSDAPLLSIGQQLGWFIVAEVSSPNAAFCPSFETEAAAPTSSPAVVAVDRCIRRRARRQRH